MGALESLVGFAASPVLETRLRRAAALAEACATSRPDAEDPHWAALLDAVTVQETRLFRHPAQCAVVAALLPAGLAAARAEGRPFRMLSAGCATGEEAFTLAALAQDATHEAPGTRIAVLGLDLRRPALASAEAGTIAPGMGEPLALVPPARRGWFEDVSGHTRLHPSLRRMLSFQRQNLLSWADKGLDVIFCRNVLIYLTEPARISVTAALRAALRPGGILALGPSDRAPAGMVACGESVWTARDV
jgi:chemotaxis protein methyltransferase CheR